MDPVLCKLMLVVPVRSESVLIELLLDPSHSLQGFTTWQGAGHGLGFESASTSEKVEGRVGRRIVCSIMQRQQADEIIEHIRMNLPIPHLVYWIEPIISAGRLS